MNFVCCQHFNAQQVVLGLLLAQCCDCVAYCSDCHPVNAGGPLQPLKNCLCRSQDAFKCNIDQATQDWGTTTQLLHKQYGLRALADGERELLISKLPPHYMLHAYANCFDRNEKGPDFAPWTAAWCSTAGRNAWLRDRPACVRLGTQALLAAMRRHLCYLSEQECGRARAPYKLPRDILRLAFVRVDPRRTGYVSLAQFMQVWQNVLQLWEYQVVERIVRGRRARALDPLRRRIVDRNAAAAVFLRFGFDRNGHMPIEVRAMGLHCLRSNCTEEAHHAACACAH